MGDGTYQDSASPKQVPGLTNVVAIASGGHSLALKNNGTVWAWGLNHAGQLGDGTFQNSASPKQVPNLTGVVAVAGGFWHSMALKTDGTVWSWGGNGVGQLGNGTFGGSITVPVQVSGLTNVVAIAANNTNGLALKSDGTVWIWGENRNGQLGNGTFTTSTPFGIATPAQVPGLTNIVAIAMVSRHILVLKSDGTVWAWGKNDKGQLGNGTLQDSAVPLQVPGLTNVIAVAEGSLHSMVLTSAPSSTVSGTIALEDCQNSVQSLTFEFQPADNSGNFQRTATLGVDGSFSLSNIPRKAYSVRIKGSKWLANSVAVDTSNGNVSNVSALLLAGDANADNAVDVLDLDLLIQAFDNAEGDTNWNHGVADFNCDGNVDVLDLDLLIRNFDQFGAP